MSFLTVDYTNPDKPVSSKKSEQHEKSEDELCEQQTVV